MIMMACFLITKWLVVCGFKNHKISFGINVFMKEDNFLS